MECGPVDVNRTDLVRESMGSGFSVDLSPNVIMTLDAVGNSCKAEAFSCASG
jgi:hypothetical protein